MSVPTESDRQRFRAEAARQDADIDLARLALLVAREEYPQLPVERYMGRIDQLSEEVRDHLDAESAPPVVLQELLRTLYEKHGFRGNEEAYYDPRNSFLNDVIDRALGIPLTLGIVILEIGWRLGLPLTGINFPMHFLVGFRGDAVRLLVDPFDGGRIYFEDQAQELLDRAYGGMIRMQPAFLREASKRDMVYRLLTNLKGIYGNVGDDRRALAAVERMLLVRPASAADMRDRGILLARLGRDEEAREQLSAYLEYAPRATDAGRIRGILAGLGRVQGTRTSDDD